jgi:chromosome segregation ATPase
VENSEEQRRKLMREVEALTVKLEEARAAADKLEKSKKKLQAEVRHLVSWTGHFQMHRKECRVLFVH